MSILGSSTSFPFILRKDEQSQGHLSLPSLGRMQASCRCTWLCATRTDHPFPWWTSSSRMGVSPRSPSILCPSPSWEECTGCLLALTFLLLLLHRGTLDRVTQNGNTALHYGALYNQPNCLKLLLKGKATFTTGMSLGWGFWAFLVGAVRLQLGFVPLLSLGQ